MILADLLCENDLRARLIALQAKLPERWKNEDGSTGGRNPHFADWLAKQPDEALPQLKIELEALLARPKTKIVVQRRSRAQLSTLNVLLQRGGKRFARWMRALYDDPQDLARCQADRDCLVSSFVDYLGDELSVEVRHDGLIAFWQLVGDTERLIGDLPIALFHFTSSRVMRSVREHGLEGDRDPVNDRVTEGVYLTTEQSGPAVQGYIGRAMTSHGGHGVMLTIKCYLDELMPDPDDADISSGRTQFMVDHVPPTRIIKVERYTRI